VTAVVAVDFGASSIRVCRVDLDEQPPALRLVHRYAHEPVADRAGVLRWDWSRLVAEMEKGLAAALEAGPVASIGIDTWGVDYGLLDARGEPVAPPVSYRDGRTAGYEAVVARLGGDEALYRITGVQLQPFNTVFQLAAHDTDELARARNLVLLPELLVHHLTGEIVGERTSAGTTGLVDIASGDWSAPLLDRVGLDASVLPPLLPAGTRVGAWQGVPVHLVGGHDTASAVVAMGPAPGPGSAFVSTGTWLLVGREQPDPDLGDRARQANFSNEIGALGGVRFLKNLAGSWLVERCRTAWAGVAATAGAAGSGRAGASVGELLTAAETVEALAARLDVADRRFLNPADMLGEVTAALGLPVDAPPPVVVRGIVESQAAATARVLDELGGVTDVHVIGGVAQAGLYVRLLAERAGVRVHAGPVEATALGNALVQGVALGLYTDLADARRHLAGDAVNESRR
jgi:rhamnulokinase